MGQVSKVLNLLLCLLATVGITCSSPLLTLKTQKDVPPEDQIAAVQGLIGRLLPNNTHLFQLEIVNRTGTTNIYSLLKCR